MLPGFIRRFRTLALVLTLLVASVGVFDSRNALGADACQTFKETGFTVCGKFLAYWQSHGGLAQQGFPISDVFDEQNQPPPAGDGQVHKVQYFQRARFEEHLENQPPYDVLLGLLGTEQFNAKYPPGSETTTTRHLDGECQDPDDPSKTTYAFCGIFLDYWRSHGGLAQQGYPLSDVFEERNAPPPAGDGKIHRVQYFERARFEEHTEAPPAYIVQLGLLGTEQYNAKKSQSNTVVIKGLLLEQPRFLARLPERNFGTR